MLEESIIIKLESLRSRSKEISEAILMENATDDMSLYTKLNKEYAEITPIVDLFRSLRDAESDLADAKELLDSGDSELIELAKIEINTNQEKISELEKNIKLMLLPKDRLMMELLILRSELEQVVMKPLFLLQIYLECILDYLSVKVGN